jgi:AcrR family transcriptional regulator
MARNKQVSDEQLMETARATFLELGPHISVAVIAKRLGVTPAALFHRLGSKEELLRRALWPRIPPERIRLQAGFKAGAAPSEQMAEILAGLCHYMASGVPAIFLMHAGGVPTPADKKGEPFREPQMIALRRELVIWMLQAFKVQKMSKIRAEVLADAFIGTLEGRFMHAYLQGVTFSEKKNRAFVEGLIREIMH